MCWDSPTSTSKSIARKQRASASLSATRTRSCNQQSPVQSQQTFWKATVSSASLFVSRLIPPIIDAVGAVKVAYTNSTGINAYVPLRELADISLDTGPSFIYRERGQRYVPIKFSMRGRDLGSTVAEAQATVARR